MKPVFNIDSDYDICLLPYSPITESDRLEVRLQIFNSGASGEVGVKFYLDDDLIGTEKIIIGESSYGFVRIFTDVKGKCGKHTVYAQINSDDGEIRNSKASIPLEIVKSKEAVLDGGFVMLGPPNDRKTCDTFRDDLKRFTDKHWNKYISEMFSMGISCIIINVCHQYLTLENKELTAHYPSKLMPKSDIAAIDPIAVILDVAQKKNKKVFLGVGNQFGHKGTESEMTELFNRYGHFKSFYGWYFATELRMDINTEAEFEKWHLYNYLHEIAHKLCPVKPILISPMAMPSDMFADLFSKIFFCDIIMPQDWVGQCAFHIEDSHEMYRKLHDICLNSDKHLWANCESFNFTDTPDGKWENWGCTFENFPWDAPRVLVPLFRGGGITGEQGFDKQMEAVRPYTEKIMTFMLSGFFCPEDFEIKCGGEAAVSQYKNYILYKQNRRN